MSQIITIFLCNLAKLHNRPCLYYALLSLFVQVYVCVFNKQRVYLMLVCEKHIIKHHSRGETAIK